MDDNQLPENAPESNDNQANSQSETMFTRDQLAKIVASSSAKAAQNARKEAEDKYQQTLNALSANQKQNNASVSRDDEANAIYQKVQEKFNADMQLLQEQHKQEQMRSHMKQIADTYISKINSGKTAYEDFDAITKDYDATAFPQVTYLLAGMDNAADILYELVKNPLKIAAIDELAKKQPQMATNELLKLSQSITTNKQAQANAENQYTPAPLDRLQPSRVSGSNGKMTISDLRNLPWLKG